MGNTFSDQTTAEEVRTRLGVSLVNRNVLLTGATNGIGVETARSLLRAGATVFFAVRNVEAGNKLATELTADAAANGSSGVARVLYCDLNSLATVKSCAAEFLALNIPLHILINNAGIMAVPYGKTVDGYELQFGTNVVGHWILTNALLPALRAAGPGARIINVASRAHRMSSGIPENVAHAPQNEYSAMTNYGHSKLGNILMANEFQRRWGAEGITSVSLHPGVIRTNLTAHSSLMSTAMTVGDFMLKSIPAGAATTVYCALTPDLTPGYYSDCKLDQPTLYGKDAEAASRLWTLLETAAGLHLGSSAAPVAAVVAE